MCSSKPKPTSIKKKKKPKPTVSTRTPFWLVNLRPRRTLALAHFPTRTQTWPLRPPASTPPPRLLLPRQSPRLHPHRIKRSLLLLMPLSPMRLRPRQHRLLRPCPRQRRGSGSSRKRGSTPPNTTRSVPSSPTCVSASSRFTLNISFFSLSKIPTRASCVLWRRRQSWSLNLGKGQNPGYMIIEQPFSEFEYLLPATDMQCSFSCYGIL